MDDDGLSLLQIEMQLEEVHLKVNAIHRLKTVILSIGQQATIDQLIPYLSQLVKTEDDEVLFAIAEEIGNVFNLMQDKTMFLGVLEELAAQSETVVREQAAKSLNKICETLTDAEIQSTYAPLVIKLAQGEWFPPRQTSCHLFKNCYKRSSNQKDKLRKKFIELCNEDQPMIRRCCANILGEFATELDKTHVLQEILPIFRQLSQDEQDVIRVKCLESLIPMAKYLTKEENQIHTLGTLLAAGEDKSWQVRLSFAKNFAAFANSFGKEITDNNLIQTFTLLLNDSEFEVKLAAINSIQDCLPNISLEKIINLMLPTLQQTYPDGTAQFRAGTATALCAMSQLVGKDITKTKILPILTELIKDDNSEVKLNVVQGLYDVASIVGIEAGFLTLLQIMSNMTKEGQWRVRMAVFELLGNLGLLFGRDSFQQHIQPIFFGYLVNTAAAVRQMGVKKSAEIAENFKSDWIVQQFIPAIHETYKLDKKGYNFRICCLQSLAVVIPYLSQDQIREQIVPIFVLAMKDDIPNVRFTVAKLIYKHKSSIDPQMFATALAPGLMEQAKHEDPDVQYYSGKALLGS